MARLHRMDLSDPVVREHAQQVREQLVGMIGGGDWWGCCERISLL